MKFWHSLQIQSVSNPLSEPCFSHHLLPNSLFDQILYLIILCIFFGFLYSKYAGNAIIIILQYCKKTDDIFKGVPPRTHAGMRR